jgi:hypothetical protein
MYRAVEVDANAIGGHHEQFASFVEQLGES